MIRKLLSMNVKAALAALSVLTWMAAGMSGAQAETLKLGYVEFPPYTFTDAGKPQGSLVEVMKKIAKDAGYTLDAQSAPAKRLFQGVADGDFHLFLGIKTPKEFQDTTLVSESVVAKIELRAYALGTPPTIQAKEDLVGKPVIVLSGYSYGGWRAFMDDAANKVQVNEARTAEQALSMLKGGKAPVLLQYTLPMEQAQAAQPVSNLQSSFVSSLDCYIVVSKKTPDAATVLSKLEASFKKLQAAGQL